MANSTKIILLLCGAGLVCLLALIAGKMLFHSYYLYQNGMYPTLPASSLMIAANRPYSGIANVKRGDIIVFVREEKGNRYNYIWRVVALPGDKVQTKGNTLLINGKATQRERVREADGMSIYREHIGDASYEVAFDRSPEQQPPDVTMIVPSYHFFVMGDNRCNAYDSRYLGPVPFSTIIGRKL